jgi:integrase
MASRKPLARGEGTEPVQLPNGKWRGRVMVNGRRESVTCATPGEVRALMRELRAEDGRPPPPDVPTLAEWVTQWLEDYTPDDVKANTIENYRWGLAKFEPLGRLAMGDLETSHIEARLRELARAGLGRRSLVIALGHLALCIDAYNVPRRLTFNPARPARIPKSAHSAKLNPRTKENERRTMTTEQARAFLEAARDDPAEAALVVMLWLGLRPGEACGLPWSAIDLEAGTLDVVQFREVTRVAGEATETQMAPPKADSDRRLQLPQPVAAALRRRQRTQRAEQVAAAYWEDWGLVMTTATGKPLDPANLRRTVRRVAKAAGIDWTPELRPYELRHTAGSLLVESGLPLEEVADLLGHSVQVLIDNYRHRSKRVVAAHVAHTEAMFGG